MSFSEADDVATGSLAGRPRVRLFAHVARGIALASAPRAPDV